MGLWFHNKKSCCFEPFPHVIICLILPYFDQSNGFFHILSTVDIITYVYPLAHNKWFLLLTQCTLHPLKWIFHFFQFHCYETLNVTILIYVTTLITHMIWGFFHCDENLNVTVLVNIMTQTSHTIHDNLNFFTIKPILSTTTKIMFYLPHRSHVDHLVKHIIGMSALLYNNNNSCCHCHNLFCFHCIMSFHSAKFDFQHYVLHYLHLIYREEGKRNISKVYLIKEKKGTHTNLYTYSSWL